MSARKIDYAVAAPRLFAHQLPLPGLDRGAVLSFGNTFRIEQPFTDSPATLDLALSALPEIVAAAGRRGEGEGTRLYDSLADAADYFARRADRSRPWVLIAVTDGIDTASRTFDGAPRAVGRHLATHFASRAATFPFLVGVGSGGQIDRRALALVGEYGGFPALLIDAFPLLQEVFARLALKVTRAVSATVVRGPGFVMSSVRPGVTVGRRPIDYAFLIDRSGSMNGHA
jgi:hypothetical protein